MKLLHFALITPNSPQWGLRNALKSIAPEGYEEFNWFPYWDANPKRLEEIRDGLLTAARRMKPDLVFCQIQTPNIVPGPVLDEVREVSKFVMSWCGDCRNETPAWAWACAKYIDLHTFSNHRDVDNLRERGFKAEFLNIGFSPEVFTPKGLRAVSAPPIVFLGSNYGSMFPRSMARQKMVRLLRETYGPDFMVRGNGWGHAEGMLTEEEEAAIYRGCKIAINQNHYDNVPRFSSDRIFRAMGSGAFVVSNYWPGLEEDFEIDRHLVVWKDFGELIDKIEYYLEHDDERETIRAAGTEHVRTRHTWDSRMKEICGFYDKMQQTLR